MKDELDEPLGLDAVAKDSSRSRFSRKAIGASLLALAAIGSATLALLPRDRFSAGPHAVARIETPDPASDSLSAPLPGPPDENPMSGGERAESDAGSGSRVRVMDADEIERQTGVKVTRAGNSESPGALILQVEKPAGAGLRAAPDKRLVERGKYGPLPRIGADGATPRDVYARPVSLSPKARAEAPRIALVVGGLGLKSALTASAINELPEAVSLAFAPYGARLEHDVARARERGHEILLQAPMEPFDYPQNDPGPHTLLTGASSDRAIDDLHWLMSRFTGYVGIVNFLGARFTADEKALTPALAEIAARGLLFLDDGTSPQSLVPKIAPRFMLPMARADIVLDARPTPAAIDAALAQLEARARQNGKAIGFASALPSTIVRLSRFARDAERHGFALTPVSALIASSRNSQTGSSK